MPRLSIKGEEFLNKLADLYEEYGVETCTDADTNRPYIGMGNDNIIFEEIQIDNAWDGMMNARCIRQHIEEQISVPNGLPTVG